MKTLLSVFMFSLFSFYLSQAQSTNNAKGKVDTYSNTEFDKITNENNNLRQYGKKLLLPKLVDLGVSNYILYQENLWPSTCTKGTKQSPINFPPQTNKLDSTPVIQITNTYYNLLRGLELTIKNGYLHSIIIPSDQGGYIKVKKNKFDYIFNVTEIQFHYPSEHTFDNNYGDLEMQIIHTKDTRSFQNPTNPKDPDSKHQYLIIAILFKAFETAPNNDNISTLKAENQGPVLNFNLTLYAPVNTPFLFYEGSTTIPFTSDCTENVNWIILTKFDTLTRSQLKAFVNWILKTYNSQGNSRSTQPLNGRKLYYQFYNETTTSEKTANSNSKYLLLKFYKICICLSIVILVQY